MNTRPPRTAWKKLVFITLAVVVAVAWLGLLAGVVLDAPKTWKLVLIATAAFATETAFWVVAAVLGVSVYQARRQIWARITAAFRRSR